MRCGFGHSGNNRDGSGSAADDDDFLAGIIEIFGPMLGMDELTAKLFSAGKRWSVAGIVTIVAGATVEEVARILRGFAAFCAFNLKDPLRTLG